MNTLIFTRTGSKVYFPGLPPKHRAEGRGANREPTVHSDVGEVAASLKWLHDHQRELDIKLVFYGAPTWQQAFLPNLHVIHPAKPPERTVGGLIRPLAQREWLTSELMRVMSFCEGKVAVLDWSGMVLGWGYGCNAGMFCARNDAERYLPPLWWCQSLGWPRLTMMCDAVRCYPQQPEMTCWPGARPSALVGHRTLLAKRKVNGVSFDFDERRMAAIFNWCTDARFKPEIPEIPRTLQTLPQRYDPFVMIGHAHINMGYHSKKRADVYETLRLADLCDSGCAKIYGEGWSAAGIDATILPQSEVISALSRARTTLMLSPVAYGDCITTKLRLCAWCGVAPILYGNSAAQSYTYDLGGHFVPLDSPWRVSSAEQLRERISTRPSHQSTWAAEMCEATKPDYLPLQELVTDAFVLNCETLRAKWGGVK